MTTLTVTVLGHNGYLGAIVERRWAELGATVCDDGEYIVNCIRPDDVALSRSLSERVRLISPSTDAIDEDTPYARTKRFIEAIPSVVIRSGIVDVRHDYPAAFHNWSSNPLTPLEWADAAWALRDRPGVHVLGREPVSRFQIASWVARLWDRPRPQGGWSPERLDRVQPCRRSYPPLYVALEEFRDWLRS